MVNTFGNSYVFGNFLQITEKVRRLEKISANPL